MMFTLENRIMLFLTACIGTRFLFSYIASIVDGVWAKLFAIVLGAIGMGFLVIYFGGLRKTGAEAGGMIWWNHMRPLHGALYVFAAISLGILEDNSNASRAIFIDTIIGLMAFLHHHFM